MPIGYKQPANEGGLPDQPLALGSRQSSTMFKDGQSEEALRLIVNPKPGDVIGIAGLWDTKDDKVWLRASAGVIGHYVYDSDKTPGIKEGDTLKAEIFGFGGLAQVSKLIINPETGHYDKTIPKSHQQRFEQLMDKLFKNRVGTLTINDKYEK